MRKSDLYLALIVLLVALAAFALGRLSAIYG